MHAEGLLAAGPATYVATGRRDPDDAEWEARIERHRSRRPPAWRTVEAEPESVLRHAQSGDPPILIDDLATWLAGVLDDTGGWEGSLEPARKACTALTAAVERCPVEMVVVSAEVGLGVIPATRSGRLFRDELGALNAAMAEHCTEVVLLIAGLPLRLKPGR